MLTPKFELEQTSEFICIHINVPFGRPDDMDFYVFGNEFKFYLRPYFLRLHFPNELVEDGREHASYDRESGKLHVWIPKAIAGQDFPDLDLLTTLKPKQVSLIEVLDSEDVDEEVIEHFHDMDTVDFASEAESLRVAVGFDGQYSDSLNALSETCIDRVDFTLSPAERALSRQRAEDAKFDPGYFKYAQCLPLSDCIHRMDFINDDEIEPAINMQCWWMSNTETVTFSEQEKDMMRELPHKECTVLFI